MQYPSDIGVVFDKLMANLDGYFGELGEEMKAIAEYLGIDLGIIVSLNLSYELRRVCSETNVHDHHLSCIDCILCACSISSDSDFDCFHTMSKLAYMVLFTKGLCYIIHNTDSMIKLMLT